MGTILRAPAFLHPPPKGLSGKSLETHKRLLGFSSLKQKPISKPSQINLSHLFNFNKSLWVPKFIASAAYGETTETNQVEETQTEESSDDEVPMDGSNDGVSVDAEEIPSSAVVGLLQSYKDALVNNDESKVAEIEVFLISIEEEKKSLAIEVASLSEELASMKDRVLRISADFDNFRKRTERERLSLVTNAQGEVVEGLLPVLDNFERAKVQIKVETEGEEKINNSYQSIYKQFVEVLESLGVLPVETVGHPFDPLLHEAIMREDSNEFEEGIIIQEFRKGFKLGDRLLRPSMVKVSAGPGPAKPTEAGPSEDDADGGGETREESSTEEESA